MSRRAACGLGGGLHDVAAGGNLVSFSLRGVLQNSKFWGRKQLLAPKCCLCASTAQQAGDRPKTYAVMTALTFGEFDFVMSGSALGARTARHEER